tara:strand:- start:1058 stop:1489 length:432 start_codon:yes stop_codon:yes gene_type:complete
MTIHDNHFTWHHMLARFLFSAFLVFGTYNPFGFSFFDWATSSDANMIIPKIFVGLLLVMAYRLVLVSSFLALGITGSLLLAATIIMLLASLVQFGLIPLSVQATQIIFPLGFAIFLGVGLSYSGIVQRVSRQTQANALRDSLL